jgi:hypothetical protein
VAGDTPLLKRRGNLEPSFSPSPPLPFSLQVPQLYQQNKNPQQGEQYLRKHFLSYPNEVMGQEITYRNSSQPDHLN